MKITKQVLVVTQNQISNIWRGALLALAIMSAATSHATDGYFSDGYGIKSQGRAGVALTETDDAFGGANNPAAIVWATDRIDGGISYFRPIRSAERTGGGPADGQVTSGRDDFFIPEFAFKRALNNDIAVGLSLYGNGGMNTFYKDGVLGPNNILFGPGHLGVDFTQLFVAPTIAWKFAPTQSIGLTPLIGYQRFKAYGLSAFSPLSQDPAALTDRGYDQAFGVGVRLGYLWNITPVLSVGAEYASPVFFQRFEKYQGLFAGSGAFDTPQNLGVGFGWQALPTLRLGVDYKWIDYADVAAVGNLSSNPGQLGQGSGPGFGWRSISIIKFGADLKLNDVLTLRGGYSYNENPIRSSDVTFNILAPGVIQQHLTFGGTYAFGHQELTVAYVHGFLNSVTGPSAFVPGATEKISMYQDSVGIEYSYKF